MTDRAVVLRGDARRLPLPDRCVDLIVTSPPYFGLRSYVDAGQHYDGQIGSEATPAEWVAALVGCTAEWVRVLKPSGSIFVNLGDKYSGYTNGQGKGRNFGGGERGEAYVPDGPVSAPTVYGVPNKSLMGLPWRYALACMDQLGLILRRDIIWSKPNGLPESVTDRCRSSHEYLFHLVKQPRYYAAIDEIREPHAPQSIARTHRNRFAPDLSQAGVGSPNTLNPADACNPLGKLPGSVWDIPSQPLTVPAALGIDHFAAYPMELPRRCVLGWSPPGVCTACGEGRRPVSERVTGLRLDGRKRPARDSARNWSESACGDNKWGGDRTWDRGVGATITGYACACPEPDAPVRPAVVVDPFGGTGTTALVASVYGRTGLSFDLSADYCRLARWRTRDPAERARALQVPKPPPVPDGQGSLFDDEAV